MTYLEQANPKNGPITDSEFKTISNYKYGPIYHFLLEENRKINSTNIFNTNLRSYDPRIPWGFLF